MQDAIYKPHQKNDEVFLILYVQEQPFRPLLFKCCVVDVIRNAKTTSYHLQPIDSFFDIPDVVTVRVFDENTKKYKEVPVIFDKSSEFNWFQQLANKDISIEAQQQAVFPTLKEAGNMIHKLNNDMLQRLNEETLKILKQNTDLNTII